jgi:hypothetical protein
MFRQTFATLLKHYDGNALHLLLNKNMRNKEKKDVEINKNLVYPPYPFFEDIDEETIKPSLLPEAAPEVIDELKDKEEKI